MKKFLAAAAVLLCTLGLFAKIGDPKPEIIELTFGIGAGFEEGNQFGITVGADVDWNVWEKATTKAHDGSGKMYAGLDLAFEYWVPTSDGNELHWLNIPLQGNFYYEFNTTKMQGAGPLIGVGPWYSMGIGLNILAWDGESDFEASFAWGIGAQLAFKGNWALKAGFGGDAGDHWDRSHFMAEAAYRF